MRVGIGYHDGPDSRAAGAAAATAAMADAGLDHCDAILLFSTAGHDAQALYDGIRGVVGPQCRIYGGWAVGAITNSKLGYGGYQAALAAFRLDGVELDAVIEGPLSLGEDSVGAALGEKLKQMPDIRAALLLYDSVDRTSGRMRMNMATPLLAAMTRSMGKLPPLVGAGLCGDMMGTSTFQWVGGGVSALSALALTFSGDIRMDSVIMHGCRPAGSHRVVTKADGPTILELDGRPAVDVAAEMLGADIPLEDYGFFLTLGMNKGDKWGPYDEESYVNRLCLKVDKKRGGLVMFEPDLTEGCEVQLMHRSVDLDYVAPRVEQAFQAAAGRKPVFALYINCAGRAAGYAGIEGEDAARVQQAVAGRVPLLGFYSGVEIAPVKGVPMPLDWTGVFCLFSRAA